MTSEPELRLSVIVPVRDGARVLSDSLSALLASDLPREAWELIVVDDGSADDSVRVAEPHADDVVRAAGGPLGPAGARNRGSEVATGDVLVFIDADVCVHPDTLRKFRDAFMADPGVAAVFGAYDRVPRARGLVSQYRNLLHHYVHASQPGDAQTFWAGCGAIRRSAFSRVGGFDERRYRRPQIEDIELGYRLRARGERIVLRPDIQATHLKRWTLRGMLVNDARHRAAPWMRLLLERGGVGDGTLNVDGKERLLTGAAGTGAAALLAAPFVATRAMLGVAAGAAVIVLVGNASLFRWFAHLRGVPFALGTVPLRLLYYTLNAGVAATELVRHAASRRGRPAAAAAATARATEPAPMTTERTAEGPVR